MTARLRRLAFFSVALVLFAAACGNGTSASPAPSPTLLARQATPLAPAGVVTVVEASCRMLAGGAEISVSYRARARDGVLTRVRLVKDGLVVEDSGNIESPEWDRLYVYSVNGGVHVFHVQVQAGSLQQRSSRSVVRCPELPPATRL